MSKNKTYTKVFSIYGSGKVFKHSLERGGLSAPVATAATGVSQTSFTANWEAYTGADYYLLDVSLSSTFDTFVLKNKNITAPATSYLVTGLTPETTYYYRVRASIGDLPWGIAEWHNVNIQWQLITNTWN